MIEPPPGFVAIEIGKGCGLVIRWDRPASPTIPEE